MRVSGGGSALSPGVPGVPPGGKNDRDSSSTSASTLTFPPSPVRREPRSPVWGTRGSTGIVGPFSFNLPPDSRRQRSPLSVEESRDRITVGGRENLTFILTFRQNECHFKHLSPLHTGSPGTETKTRDLFPLLLGRCRTWGDTGSPFVVDEVCLYVTHVLYPM